jgi:hypothetical protein
MSNERPEPEAVTSIKNSILKPFRSVRRAMASAKEVPSYLAKFFKTTSAARKLMDPEGRLCELDPDSHYRELVYSTMHQRQWDEMSWTQAKLYEAAQQGTVIPEDNSLS